MADLAWPDQLDPACPIARGFVRRIEQDGGPAGGDGLDRWAQRHPRRCRICNAYPRHRRRAARRRRILTRLGLLALTMIAV